MKHDPSKLWIADYAWRKNSDKKTTVAGALVNRFKEREENCRVDIIECFTRLLSYTVSAASSGVLVLASSVSKPRSRPDPASLFGGLSLSQAAALTEDSLEELGVHFASRGRPSS